MAVSVTLGGSLQFTGTFSDTIGLASLSAPPRITVTPTVASTEVTLAYSLGSTAITGTENVIDLNGGTLADAGGNTITFDRIHAVAIYSDDATNAEMTAVIADVNTANEDTTVQVRPGGCFYWYAPLGSDAGIGDITITGTATDTYQVFVIGDVA